MPKPGTRQIADVVDHYLIDFNAELPESLFTPAHGNNAIGLSSPIAQCGLWRSRAGQDISRVGRRRVRTRLTYLPAPIAASNVSAFTDALRGKVSSPASRCMS